MKNTRAEQETSKKILIDKSKNDDIYIKALKTDNQKLKAEIEKLRIETQFNIINKENYNNNQGVGSELEKVY